MGGPVFKTGVGGEKLPRWVRFPCASAITARVHPKSAMRLETNLKKIEQLSQQRDDANWEFRCFLKGCNLSIARIDSALKEIYQEVSAQIDCTTCGNCCKVMLPSLSKADIKRLALHQQLSIQEFKQRFLALDEENAWGFNQQPCPFLENNRCTVYESRPRDCRSYPHLDKREFVSRLGQALSNCSVCPIVFNVYERLQQTLRPARRR